MPLRHPSIHLPAPLSRIGHLINVHPHDSLSRLLLTLTLTCGALLDFLHLLHRSEHCMFARALDMVLHYSLATEDMDWRGEGRLITRLLVPTPRFLPRPRQFMLTFSVLYFALAIRIVAWLVHCPTRTANSGRRLTVRVHLRSVTMKHFLK